MAKRPLSRPGVRRPERGFTLIELVIVVLILFIAMTISFPALQNLLQRYNLTASAQEISTVMQIARLEAIKSNSSSIVRIVPAERTVEAFIDRDDDQQIDDGELLRRIGLGTRVRFEDQGGNTPGVLDFSTPTTAGRPNQVVFNSDGSVEDTGAFHITFGNNNYLRVRVEPRATAKVTVLKWDTGTSAWKEKTEGSGWDWY